MPPVDVIDVVTGQFVSGGEHAQRKKEQPSRTEASAEESQKLLAREQAREQARELGTATFSHAVALILQRAPLSRRAATPARLARFPEDIPAP